MKMITTDRCAEICVRLANEYLMPVALSTMDGQVPSMTLKVYRSEERDDWTATVRLKNSLTISTFNCEIYVQEILQLCRACKLWLVTEEVFTVVAAFYELHGIFQQVHMNFTDNVERDYDSMMAGAGHSTYEFIRSQRNLDTLESCVLDLVFYQSMIFTNNYKYAPKNAMVGDLIVDVQTRYRDIMLEQHPEAYRSARRQKAQNYLVDEEGFILLEPINRHENTQYFGKLDG